MRAMILFLNAVLYVIALSLSLAVLTPVPASASPRVRRARVRPGDEIVLGDCAVVLEPAGG